LQAARAQFVEGLRRGDFMHQMQIDVGDGRRFVAFRANAMRLPDLVDDGLLHRAHTGSSQPYLSSVLPLNRPKNRSCTALVIGPRVPLPIGARSTERIGVISTPVPQKKAS